jgi:hypothetical protein
VAVARRAPGTRARAGGPAMTDDTFSDAQIRAAFIARSEGSPSPDLADRIGVATRRTRQLPKLVVLPAESAFQPERLLWAAAISATSLALVGGLLFAGRQPDEQTSVVPPAFTEPTLRQPVDPVGGSLDQVRCRLRQTRRRRGRADDKSAGVARGRSGVPSRYGRPHLDRRPSRPVEARNRQRFGQARAAPAGRGPSPRHRGRRRRGRLRLVPRPALRTGYPSGWVAAGARDGEAMGRCRPDAMPGDGRSIGPISACSASTVGWRASATARSR